MVKWRKCVKVVWDFCDGQHTHTHTHTENKNQPRLNDVYCIVVGLVIKSRTSASCVKKFIKVVDYRNGSRFRISNSFSAMNVYNFCVKSFFFLIFLSIFLILVDASGARIAAYVPTQKLEWKRYKQYTNSDITAAIEAVKSGMSALQASRKFKVPSRTLYDKVKKLGIATTRPYSRVSSSTSSSAAAAANAAANSAAAAAAAAAALNAANQNNFAASTAAALTSAMAAAAMSLVKRERGPVIQVAGSSRHEAAAAAAIVAAAASSAGNQDREEDLPESNCGPADYSEDSRQESPENLTIGSSNLSTSSPGSHGSTTAPTPSSNGKDMIKKETPDSTPTPPPAPQSPPPRQSSKFSAGARVGGAYFAVRDDLNSTTTTTSSIAEVVMDDRGGSASPNPSTT